MLTKENKLAILATKEDAAFERMSEVAPTDEDFFKAVQAVHAIRSLAEVVAYTDELGAMLTEMQKAVEKVVESKIVPTPENHVFPEPKAVEEPKVVESAAEIPDLIVNSIIEQTETVAEEPTPVEEVPTAPVVSYTFAEVRAKLGAAVDTVDIPALLQEMGCTRLSEVPQERYGELLQKAGLL